MAVSLFGYKINNINSIISLDLDIREVSVVVITRQHLLINLQAEHAALLIGRIFRRFDWLIGMLGGLHNTSATLKLTPSRTV